MPKLACASSKYSVLWAQIIVCVAARAVRRRCSVGRYLASEDTSPCASPAALAHFNFVPSSPSEKSESSERKMKGRTIRQVTDGVGMTQLGNSHHTPLPMWTARGRGGRVVRILVHAHFAHALIITSDTKPQEYK
jgi:hypothetical protein